MKFLDRIRWDITSYLPFHTNCFCLWIFIFWNFYHNLKAGLPKGSLICSCVSSCVTRDPFEGVRLPFLATLGGDGRWWCLEGHQRPSPSTGGYLRHLILLLPWERERDAYLLLSFSLASGILILFRLTYAYKKRTVLLTVLIRNVGGLF